MFTSFGCRNIGIRKLRFVATTQFLYFLGIYSYNSAKQPLNMF